MLTTIKPTRAFPDNLLQQHRLQGDAPADAVIDAVVQVDGPTGLRKLMGWLGSPTDFSFAQQPTAVQEFFAQYAQLPAWADSARMQRGMAVFQKNAPSIGLMLGLYSLPFSYLGANGAQLLVLTERIKNDTARRLQETGEWVFAVNNPKEWSPKTVAGRTEPVVGAIERTLKIRLIHAGSRWFALHSGRWNMDWGMPVNQEDMAGTNLAFSYVVIMGLRKSGVTMTEREEEDYLHHINVVGSLNGVVEDLIPANLREAYLLGNAIAKRQFAPSEAGVVLTHSLLNAVVDQLQQRMAGSGSTRIGPEALRNLVAGEMRYLLGDQYADWLNIPQTSIGKRLGPLLSRLPLLGSSGAKLQA